MKTKRFLSMVLVVIMLIGAAMPVMAEEVSNIPIVEGADITFESVDLDISWWMDYESNGKEAMLLGYDNDGISALWYTKDGRSFEKIASNLDEMLTFELTEDTYVEYTSMVYHDGYYYILACEITEILTEDAYTASRECCIIRTDGEHFEIYSAPKLNDDGLFFFGTPNLELIGDTFVLACDFNSYVTDEEVNEEDETQTANYYSEYYISKNGMDWTTCKSPEIEMGVFEPNIRAWAIAAVFDNGVVFIDHGLEPTDQPSPLYGAYYTEDFVNYIPMEGILDADTSTGHMFWQVGENRYVCVKDKWEVDEYGSYNPLGVEVWFADSPNGQWQQELSCDLDYAYWYSFYSNGYFNLMVSDGNDKTLVYRWDNKGNMQIANIDLVTDSIFDAVCYNRFGTTSDDCAGCAIIYDGTSLIYSNDMWLTAKKVLLPENCYHFIPLYDTTLIGSETGYYVVDLYELGESTRPTYILGDVDGNTKIEAADALETLKAVVKLTELTETQTQAADVDGNGEVSAEDALYILQKVVKLIDKFPVEG